MSEWPMRRVSRSRKWRSPSETDSRAAGTFVPLGIWVNIECNIGIGRTSARPAVQIVDVNNCQPAFAFPSCALSSQNMSPTRSVPASPDSALRRIRSKVVNESQKTKTPRRTLPPPRPGPIRPWPVKSWPAYLSSTAQPRRLGRSPRRSTSPMDPTRLGGWTGGREISSGPSRREHTPTTVSGRPSIPRRIAGEKNTGKSWRSGNGRRNGGCRKRNWTRPNGNNGGSRGSGSSPWVPRMGQTAEKHPCRRRRRIRDHHLARGTAAGAIGWGTGTAARAGSWSSTRGRAGWI